MLHGTQKLESLLAQMLDTTQELESLVTHMLDAAKLVHQSLIIQTHQQKITN
jgi:hypothetical protein